MSGKSIQYLVVCCPEKMDVEDLVGFQVGRGNPHLVWCCGYLYEYEEEWHHEEPYTHYVTMVNYCVLREYKRYAIMDQGRLSFSDTTQEISGSAVPILMEKAEETHPRTQGILKSIKLKEDVSTRG
jgi:hypothetical protein